MYRTVNVLLNSTNIFAQEQFGGLADIKILYNFMMTFYESWMMKDTAVAFIVTLSDIFDNES